MTINSLDPALCPICGQPNECRLAKEEPSPEPCWCTRINISQRVLCHVPAAKKKPGLVYVSNAWQKYNA